MEIERLVNDSLDNLCRMLSSQAEVGNDIDRLGFIAIEIDDATGRSTKGVPSLQHPCDSVDLRLLHTHLVRPSRLPYL